MLEITTMEAATDVNISINMNVETKVQAEIKENKF